MHTQTPAVDVSLLLYPGVQLAAVYGLSDLLQVANQMADACVTPGVPRFRVQHWRWHSAGAITCEFDSQPDRACTHRVIVLPPCLGDLPDASTLSALGDWLVQQHQQGATFGSVCAGAFVLAHSGLLLGRTVTTHWHLARELAAAYPEVRVDAERLLIDEGDILSAGGVMAWTDLGLALVSRYLGPSVAAQTARFLVLDLSRQSQRHFSQFSPDFSHGDQAILKTQRWLQQHALQAVNLEHMAQQAGLGERTFLRRFRAATHLRPTEYVQQLRMQRARELLELTQRSVEQVAWDVGYQDPGAFRHVFRKYVGLSPRDYRQRFSVGAGGAAMNLA